MVWIRKASLIDLPSLMDLVDQLGYKVSLSTLSENIRIYLKDPDQALFVAEIEGRIAGFIALDIAKTFHREGSHMRVVSLVVDRFHQRRGIGKLLLQAAEDVAKKRGCWVVEVTSSSRRQKEGAHDFYMSQGYLKDGSQAYFRKQIDFP